MSITTQTIDLDGPSVELADASPKAIPSVEQFERMAREAIEKAMKAGSEAGFAHSVSFAQSLVADFDSKIKSLEAKLLALPKPKVQLTVIEVDKKRFEFGGDEIMHPMLPRLIVNCKLGINTFFVGPAGCGKSILARQAAKPLGVPFYFISMTKGASESWLCGRWTPQGFVYADLSKAVSTGGVFLLDELPASDPNVLMLLQYLLDGDRFYNPMTGETVKKHEKFYCIAAGNTAGRGGSSVYTSADRLDAAFTTRFVKIPVDYIPEIEERVCPDEILREVLQNARKKLRALKSPEIISTRCIRDIYRQVQAGIPLADTLQSLTLEWPEALVEQIGLNIKKLPEPKKPKEEKTQLPDASIQAEIDRLKDENEKLSQQKQEKAQEGKRPWEK